MGWAIYHSHPSSLNDASSINSWPSLQIYTGTTRTQEFRGWMGYTEHLRTVRGKNSMLESVKHVICTFEDIPSNHTLSLLDFQKERYQTVLNRARSSLGFYRNKPQRQVDMQNNSLEVAKTVTTDDTRVGSIPYWSGLINGLGRYSSNTRIVY